MLYTYKARIIDVYDGDSVTAVLDLGLHIKVEVKLRLYGIDTPELRGEEREKGLAARDFLRYLILDRDVIIHTIKDKTGKFGRLLAKIYIDEVNINKLLIEKGYAEVYE